MYTQVEQDQDDRRSLEAEPDVQDGLVGALARALASRRPMCVDSGENWAFLYRFGPQHLQACSCQATLCLISP